MHPIDTETADGRTKVENIPVPMLKIWLKEKVDNGIIKSDGNGWLFGWFAAVNVYMRGGKLPNDGVTQQARRLYRSVRYDRDDEPDDLIDADDNPADEERKLNWAEF